MGRFLLLCIRMHSVGSEFGMGSKKRSSLYVLKKSIWNYRIERKNRFFRYASGKIALRRLVRPLFFPNTVRAMSPPYKMKIKRDRRCSLRVLKKSRYRPFVTLAWPLNPIHLPCRKSQSGFHFRPFGCVGKAHFRQFACRPGRWDPWP